MLVTVMELIAVKKVTKANVSIKSAMLRPAVSALFCGAAAYIANNLLNNLNNLHLSYFPNLIVNLRLRVFFNFYVCYSTKHSVQIILKYLIKFLLRFYIKSHVTEMLFFPIYYCSKFLSEYS